MAPPAPEPYRVDPDDPRAPSLEVWESLSTEERARIVDALSGSDAPATRERDPDAYLDILVQVGSHRFPLSTPPIAGLSELVLEVARVSETIRAATARADEKARADAEKARADALTAQLAELLRSR